MKPKKFKTVDYNSSFYQTKELRYWARQYLKYLPKEVTFLVSTGRSGCAIASAMIVLSKRPLFNISANKPKEETHGGIAYPIYPKETDIGCIVDDFISTGKTVYDLYSRFSLYNIQYVLVSIDSEEEFYLNKIQLIEVEKLIKEDSK
jgi:orotate phosphoribosyltransferase